MAIDRQKDIGKHREPPAAQQLHIHTLRQTDPQSERQAQRGARERASERAREIERVRVRDLSHERTYHQLGDRFGAAMDGGAQVLQSGSSQQKSTNQMFPTGFECQGGCCFLWGLSLTPSRTIARRQLFPMPAQNSCSQRSRICAF